MSVQIYALQDIGLEVIPEEDEDNTQSTQPVYTYITKPRHKRQRWTKSRGQPDSSRLAQTVTRESSFTLSLEDDDMMSSCTPYRLPRLSPRTGDVSPLSDDHGGQEETKSTKSMNDKVWSRHGYEKIIRIPELGPQIRMLVPHGSSSPFSTHAPRFKNAAITPSVRSIPAWGVERGHHDEGHLQFYQSQIQEDDFASRNLRVEPTPTPISRSESPAKSVKSIHWILGHNRYHTFDKKGRSHVQGPYSREFNVTCMAPQNWLKMKWGRSKTMIH